MAIEEIHPRERVPGSLKEEHRHCYVWEPIDPQPLRLSGRVKRIGVEHDT